MNPIVVITHAAFAPERAASLRALLDQLHDHGPMGLVCSDHDRMGSLWCWRQAMEDGLRVDDATHIVSLPDDAILCPNFARLLLAAIAARPDEVFDCYANHDRPPHLESAWYTTPDGFVGLGGVFPRARLIEHLAWRDEHLDDRSANDEGVNLWAMATGRRIWKTTRSLVSHRASLVSLDNNAHHMWRTPATFSDGHDEDWTADPVHIGRTYMRNHWGLITKVRPPMTRRAYEVEKDLL